MRSSHFRLLSSFALAPLLCLAGAAQRLEANAVIPYIKPTPALPDAAYVVQESPAHSAMVARPTPANDRILAIMPNYGTAEYGQPTLPLSTFEKLHLATAGAYDFFSIPLVAGVAAIGQAKNSPKSWGQGWRAYGRRYGATFADNNIGNIMTDGIFPSLLHDDPRYYRLGHGPITHRALYAVSRLAIARTDSGRGRFNYSEFLGNAVAAGVSNLYHAPEDRTSTRNLNTYAALTLWDGVGNLMKEFWPDLHRKMQKKHKAATLTGETSK